MLNKSLDEINSVGRRLVFASSNNRTGVNKFRNAPNHLTRDARRATRIGTGTLTANVTASLHSINTYLDPSRESQVRVEGISDNISEESLRQFFETNFCGINKVRLCGDKNGKSTGTAYITFRNTDFAKLANDRFHGALLNNGSMILRKYFIADPFRSSAKLLYQKIKNLSSYQKKGSITKKYKLHIKMKTITF